MKSDVLPANWVAGRRFGRHHAAKGDKGVAATVRTE